MERRTTKFRLFADRALEEKLQSDSLDDADRRRVEFELRRRRLGPRVVRKAPTGKPRDRGQGWQWPRWVANPVSGFILAYAVPLLGMGAWIYAGWRRWFEYRGFEHESALMATLQGLYAPLLFVLGGHLSGVLDGLHLLVPLAMIPAYCIRRTAPMAIISFLGTVIWMFWGVIIMSLGV